MAAPRSESLLVLPLFPIFLLGAFPLLLMGFLGLAGVGILGALTMSAALIVGLDADTEFNAQREVVRSSGGMDLSMQSSTRDAMVRFSKAAGAAGAALVAFAVLGALTVG